MKVGKVTIAEQEQENEGYSQPADAYPATHHHAQGLQSVLQQVSTKAPSEFNGKKPWFAVDEASDDWLRTTELPPKKRGQALKTTLTEDAATHKSLLDRTWRKAP